MRSSSKRKTQQVSATLLSDVNHKRSSADCCMTTSVSSLPSEVNRKRLAKETTGIGTTKTEYCTNTGEIKALLQLYSTCGGVMWKQRKGWTATAEKVGIKKKNLQVGLIAEAGSARVQVGDWYGVTTYAVPPHNVTHVDLNNNKLCGPLRKVDGAIANLTKLTTLSLYDNRLTGTIPTHLCLLEHLKFLRLGNNALSGRIPNDIGNLTNLKWLRLNSNKLTGTH